MDWLERPQSPANGNEIVSGREEAAPADFRCIKEADVETLRVVETLKLKGHMRLLR
jgi:hypothetical protein